MKSTNNPWLALVIVLTAPLLSVIDVFIVNVAIPAIKTGVHASDAQIQLVIAGYLLGYASFLITAGKAGDQFGRKRIFILGMLCFTLFSCFCGMAQTPLQLNVVRFFQGISAAFMVPQSIAFIHVLFINPKERAKAIGWFGITLGIASITGQVLGGFLSEFHGLIEGWRLIFFINLPVGIVALWAASCYLPETERHPKSNFDYSGVVILTIGLFCLIYPLTQGREANWPAWSLLMILISMLLLGVFIWDQRAKLAAGRIPLMNIQLFKNQEFSIGLIAVLFHFMMHTSYLLTSAVFLQSGLGISASKAGVYFIIPGLLFTLSSVTAAKLLPKYGRSVPQVGVMVLILSFGLQIVFFKIGVASWIIFTLMGIYGLGNGLVLPSLLNLTLRSVPEIFAGSAAGVYSTFQQTASALGICIIGGIFYAFSSVDFTKGFVLSSYANIVCLLLTGLVLLLLPRGNPGAIKIHAVE